MLVMLYAWPLNKPLSSGVVATVWDCSQCKNNNSTHYKYKQHLR